ncbi:MAG: ISNCY family transposase, partial [Candidatus Gracilibacteria bacterium]|nr:ISNCY family transposase [Candidatus Gracilibacteria bacterium]
MVQPVVLTFEEMIGSLRSAINKFPDIRTGKNTRYEMMDAAAGAFSVFFTQCPSFLEYQKLMEKRYGLSNARTLFGIKDIPSDNHIRDLLDPVVPDSLFSVFDSCFDALETSGHLDSFRVGLGSSNKDLLIAVDGTEYHSSETIHCNNCSARKRDGQTRYLHSMVTPTVVMPGKNTVVSLPPEFIMPQDGTTKQDCEQNATKRWIKKHGKTYSSANVTILGDDLYAHEPMTRLFLEKGFNFVLVCKPESHKTLYEWINGITKEKIVRKWDGKYHQVTTTYKYCEGVPLRDGNDALMVNFVEVTVTREKDGKKLYHNAFVTNHPITEETVEAIVLAGRTRWKIENENNNTLKTQGYHLEHNFGHGKKNLSMLLATMNILAFLFHTLLELMDGKYKLLRKVI